MTMGLPAMWLEPYAMRYPGCYRDSEQDSKESAYTECSLQLTERKDITKPLWLKYRSVTITNKLRVKQRNPVSLIK